MNSLYDDKDISPLSLPYSQSYKEDNSQYMSMATDTGKIRGPWRWVGSFQPDGQSSFDMTAWQDTDGTGYLVRSVGNSYLGVSRLNENFTDTEGICTYTYQVQQLIPPSQIISWAMESSLIVDKSASPSDLASRLLESE